MKTYAGIEQDAKVFIEAAYDSEEGVNLYVGRWVYGVVWQTEEDHFILDGNEYNYSDVTDWD